MKPYYDYEPQGTEKRFKLLDNSKIIYKELEQLKKDNKLENYDLFRIIPKSNTLNLEHLMFYKDGEFYYIESRSTTFKMLKTQLSDKQFQFVSQGDNIYENGVQKYIKRHSKEEFEQLDMETKLSIIQGTYFKDVLDDSLDGLINTFKDIIATLKEDN